jgi:hypothetical protein
LKEQPWKTTSPAATLRCSSAGRCITGTCTTNAIHVPEGQPVQQAQTVEVFCSPERPGITPLFGTAQPPKWLSGAIRRLAYKLPENDLRHWLMLIAADRVNMVEGVVEDLMQGHLPNVLGEMGIRAEMRHNPAGLVRKALITTTVVGAAVMLLQRRRRY